MTDATNSTPPTFFERLERACCVQGYFNQRCARCGALPVTPLAYPQLVCLDCWLQEPKEDLPL